MAELTREVREWRDQNQPRTKSVVQCQCDDEFAGKRKIMRKDDYQETWNTGCKFTLAETGSRNVVRRSMESSHERAVCWRQRDQRLVGGVTWRRDDNVVNNSWSVDAWRSLAGDVVGDAESQRHVIMRVRMPWKGIRNSEGIADELHLPQR